MFFGVNKKFRRLLMENRNLLKTMKLREKRVLSFGTSESDSLLFQNDVNLYSLRFEINNFSCLDALQYFKI